MTALVCGSKDRLRLDWVDGYATGPDWTRYFVQTSRPLYEPAYSYAIVRVPGKVYPLGQEGEYVARDCPYGDPPTVREAKKVCEFDAWDRAGRPSS